MWRRKLGLPPGPGAARAAAARWAEAEALMHRGAVDYTIFWRQAGPRPLARPHPQTFMLAAAAQRPRGGSRCAKAAAARR